MGRFFCGIINPRNSFFASIKQSGGLEKRLCKEQVS